jgi:hypothetical protein
MEEKPIFETLCLRAFVLNPAKLSQGIRRFAIVS